MAVVGSSIIVFATSGLASPFLYLTVVLGIVVGVFVPFPAGAALLGLQIGFAWLFAWLGASGALHDFNLAAFGGGDRSPGPPGFLVAHAAMLTFVYAFALAAGRTIRGSFERIVSRAVAAQQESLRAHAERAEELTALSGEIAHELKNPLASVKGLAGLLAQQLPEGKGAERLARAPPRGGPDAVDPRGVPRLLPPARAARARRRRRRGDLPARWRRSTRAWRGSAASSSPPRRARSASAAIRAR